MRAPTRDELHAAWLAMRTRHGLRHWPQDFDAVMADALRAQCVAIEAQAAHRRALAQPLRHTSLARATGLAPRLPETGRRPPIATTTTDLKRAASGDRDDD